MRTNKQLAFDKKLIDSGEFPNLPQEYNWLISDAYLNRELKFKEFDDRYGLNAYFYVKRHNDRLKHLVKIGLLDAKLHLTEAGKNYYIYCNKPHDKRHDVKMYKVKIR